MNTGNMSYRVYRRRWRIWLMVLLLVFGLGPMWGVTGGITKAEAATTSWSSVGPAVPSSVESLVNVNGTLYAGTGNGSNDVWSYNGTSWTQMSGSPSNVFALLSVNGTLYAGTQNGSNAVWKYNGTSWTQMSGSPSNVNTLLYVNGTLYAGTGNGSNDVWAYNGTTWVQIANSPSNVSSLLSVSGTLYVGTRNSNNAVYSYSGGQWTPMSGSPGEVQSLFDLNGKLYAGTFNGTNDVWSYDGSTWTKLSNSPHDVYSLSAVNGTLYAGTQNGFNDVWAYNGTSWNPISGSPSYVNSLVAVNGALYAGTGSRSNGVWTYNGTSWSQVGGQSIGNIAVYALADVNGTLYAGTQFGGINNVWMYDGTSWTQMIGSPGNVNTLIDVGGTLYVGTGNGSNDVWKYDGASWKQMIGSPSNVNALLYVNGTLYAGTGNGSNYVWAYNGTSWTQMIGSPGNVNTLLDVGGTLYAGTSTGGNNVWAYNGTSWNPMSGSPANVYSLLDVNGALYAGTQNGSNDVWVYNGTSWNPMQGSPSNVANLLNVNGTLYAGTAYGNNGVWKCESGTWTQMSGSPNNGYFLLDMNGTLYAGTNTGVQSLVIQPGTPTNLQATNSSSTSTTLTWGTVAGATSYNVYETGKSAPIAAGVTGTSYTVTGLTPGASYSFTVSAVDAASESPQSSAVTVNTAKIGSVDITPSGADVLSGSSVTVSGVVYDVYHVPVSYAIVDLFSPVGSFGGSSTVTADVYGAFNAKWNAPSVTSETATTVTASVYGTVYGAVSNVNSTTIPLNIAPPPTIATKNLPGGSVGTSYSQMLDAANGFAPYSWSLTKGSLPSGLLLDSSAGVISGIPTTTGTCNFTLQVNDAAGNTATQALSITVSAPAIRSSSGSASNNGGISTPSDNYFSTVVQGTVNVTYGGTPETVSVQGSEVTLQATNAPTNGLVSITTQNLDTLPKITTNLPITANVTSAVGVHYIGTGFPMTVTISNPAIRIGSAVDEWVHGQLLQVPATVVNGKVTLQISKDANLVVVTPKPMLLQFNLREIVWNGQSYGVNAFVKTDPNTGVKTTYMPIWYVMKVLKNAGITSTWNGHTWMMTTVSHTSSNSGTGLSQRGNMTISLNRQTNEQVPGVVGIDPVHGNKTTYMPIWYVMKILNQAWLHSDWTGKMWALYPAEQPTTQQ